MPLVYEERYYQFSLNFIFTVQMLGFIACVCACVGSGLCLCMCIFFFCFFLHFIVKDLVYWSLLYYFFTDIKGFSSPVCDRIHKLTENSEDLNNVCCRRRCGQRVPKKTKMGAGDSAIRGAVVINKLHTVYHCLSISQVDIRLP